MTEHESHKESQKKKGRKKERPSGIHTGKIIQVELSLTHQGHKGTLIYNVDGISTTTKTGMNMYYAKSSIPALNHSSGGLISEKGIEALEKKQQEQERARQLKQNKNETTDF